MNNNKIVEINNYTFNGILADLYMNSNEINKIEDESFFCLRNLKHIKLDHNKTNEIGCVLRRLKNINKIQLNNNLISEFDENAFNDLFELKRIELNNNNSNGHYYVKLKIILRNLLLMIETKQKIFAKKVYILKELNIIQELSEINGLDLNHKNIYKIEKIIFEKLQKI